MAARGSDRAKEAHTRLMARRAARAAAVERDKRLASEQVRCKAHRSGKARADALESRLVDAIDRKRAIIRKREATK